MEKVAAILREKRTRIVLIATLMVMSIALGMFVGYILPKPLALFVAGVFGLFLGTVASILYMLVCQVERWK